MATEELFSLIQFIVDLMQQKNIYSSSYKYVLFLTYIRIELYVYFAVTICCTKRNPQMYYLT